MLLKTERLSIRHIVAEDWKNIRDIWLDFKLSEYAQYDIPHNTEEEDVRARIARWASFNAGAEHMFFAICVQDTLIGYIAFNIVETEYEIGYCFHSEFHGKGYAKESLLAILEYLHSLGITKFFVGTALNNTPSVALLTSVGFQLVDTEKVSFYKDSDGNDIVFDGGVYKLEYESKHKKVAFICVHNSCRSQIAEALGKHFAADVFESYSAGSETKPQINQDAVRIMKELYGIDMEATQYSKLISDIPNPDIAISMGCNVGCPFIGRAFDDNWGLEDPTGKSDEEFKIIIREIENRILQLKDNLKEI